MNGERATKQRIKGCPASCHNELTRLGGSTDSWSLKGKTIGRIDQPFNLLDYGIFLVLGHRKRYKESLRNNQVLIIDR
jgi:hypothetical protein